MYVYYVWESLLYDMTCVPLYNQRDYSWYRRINKVVFKEECSISLVLKKLDLLGMVELEIIENKERNPLLDCALD